MAQYIAIEIDNGEVVMSRCKLDYATEKELTPHEKAIAKLFFELKALKLKTT
jgi:hypothetical protein